MRLRFLFLTALLTLVACGRGRESAESAGADDAPVVLFEQRDPNLRPVLAWYEGTLPCDGCEGIDTELVLYGDFSSYLMRETKLYASGAETTYTARGHWRTLPGGSEHPDAVVYQLDFDRPDRARRFLRVDNGTIRLLAPDGGDLATGANTVLARIDTAYGG